MVDEEQLAEVYDKVYYAYIFLKSYIVPVFLFRFLNCLELIFVYGVRKYSSFIVLFIV